jgi:hypothetical protein
MRKAAAHETSKVNPRYRRFRFICWPSRCQDVFILSIRLFVYSLPACVLDFRVRHEADARGPMLLLDVWFLEKLAHFDRELIPERRIHAKGSAAYGTLTVNHDITRFTAFVHN